MICPRCDTKEIEVMAKSPVGDVWEVYLCKTCWYSWRSTETPDKTDPARYARNFKLEAAKIPELLVMPPIPPLKT